MSKKRPKRPVPDDMVCERQGCDTPATTLCHGSFIGDVWACDEHKSGCGVLELEDEAESR